MPEVDVLAVLAATVPHDPRQQHVLRAPRRAVLESRRGNEETVGVAGPTDPGRPTEGAVTVPGVPQRMADRSWRCCHPLTTCQDDEPDSSGWPVAACDGTGDTAADLAIGPPCDYGGTSEPAVRARCPLLRGSASGLTAAGRQLWSQHSPGAAGVATDPDRFGGVPGDRSAGQEPLADLATGASFDDIGPVGNAGAVTTLLGTGSGLSAPGAGQRIPRTRP
jgi:hypothetical protein